VRYVNDKGRAEYFSPKGYSMRKAFLRTPVKFNRISSRFTRGRMHPVLQRMRAHKGVDYAAARGTPIKAAGDGRVVFSGRKGGYGKTVVLKHGGTYTTLYAHMSRMHRRAKTGKYVQQGQVIGYVGKTGLATGPHLHYEFRVRGRHVDPLRVKLPKALPIDARYKTDFLRKSRPLTKQLDTLANTSIASNQ
jgi:murein DD-endopeptidase MepM/ murein hydrolase activator NlpD